jgi:multiple sugar transport system permease protein
MPRRRPTRSFGYLLSAPYVLCLAAFGVIPTVYAVYLSLVSPATGAFAGLGNFTAAFTDFRFLPAAENVGLYLAIWLPFMTVMVILVALLLNATGSRLSGAFRTVYYLPGAFTGSMSVLLWIFILDPNIGPFSWLLGPHWQYISQVVTNGRLPLIFALMSFTSGAGGWIVIMYGALQVVGKDVIEAARIDGAGPFRLAWRIQLPLIRKYIVYMLILSLSAGLQLFAEPLILGPTLSVGSTTWSLNELALTMGIQDGNVGEAAALSLAILAVGVVGAALLIMRTDFFGTKEGGL